MSLKKNKKMEVMEMDFIFLLYISKMKKSNLRYEIVNY